MVTHDTPDILKQIVEVERGKVARLKIEKPVSMLRDQIQSQTPALNLAGSLMSDRVRVIAEIKRSSPVKGSLSQNADAKTLAGIYADNGAAAISVLTNETHFNGSIEDLEVVHSTVNGRNIPVLRKEFIFDPYQVHEARAYGADAILLIVSMLTPSLLSEFIALAKEYWMQCLVEIHDEEELKVALDTEAEIIGVNNRNLRTFETDLEVAERLIPMLPGGRIAVAESGITTRKDVQQMGKAGAHAVLIGESLVTAKDPASKLQELI